MIGVEERLQGRHVLSLDWVGAHLIRQKGKRAGGEEGRAVSECYIGNIYLQTSQEESAKTSNNICLVIIIFLLLAIWDFKLIIRTSVAVSHLTQ